MKELKKKKYGKFQLKRDRKHKILLLATDDRQVHLIADRNDVEDDDDVIEIDVENVLDGNFWRWLEDRMDCEFCERTFATFAGRERHVQAHLETMLNQDVRTTLAIDEFECEFCQKVLRTEIGLNHHKREVHGLTLECERCGQEFRSRSNLKNHICQHKGDSYDDCKSFDQFECEFCEKVVRTEFGLNRHKREIHGLTVTHECEKCLQKFESRSNRVNHNCQQKETYDEYRSFEPFKCDTCSAGFFTLNCLKLHESEHNESFWSKALPLVFQCNECRLSFKSMDQLLAHRESHTSRIEIIDIT